MLKNLDREIEQKELELEQLRQAQAVEKKKYEGVEQFRTQINTLCNEYGLSRDELFSGLGDEILDWVKSMNRLSDSPAAYNDLKTYFARVLAREGNTRKTPAKRAVKSGPKLAVGTYRNPQSGETIEKIKRNPKTLDQWIEQFGLDTVMGWKI